MALLEDIHSSEVMNSDPGARLDSTIRQINEWGRIISNEDRTKVTKDDSGTNRILSGFQENGFSNGNVGFKMSQEGVDVQNATDEELIFSTDFNLFKVVQKGEVSLSMPSISSTSTATVSDVIEHDLGYSPLVIAFISYDSPQSPGNIVTRFFGSGDINYGTVAAGSISITYLSIETVEATPTNLYISWTQVNGGALTLPPVNATVKYYVLVETAGA